MYERLRVASWVKNFAQLDTELSDSFFSCRVRYAHTANTSLKNRLRHFSVLPTHHPYGGGETLKYNKLKLTKKRVK
jgi:hypothetical protein